MYHLIILLLSNAMPCALLLLLFISILNKFNLARKHETPIHNARQKLEVETEKEK